jgi:hypothetical protein
MQISRVQPNRRQFNRHMSAGFAALLTLAYTQAHALSLADLTDKDAGQGLKAALEKGAQAAVSLLGQADGFMGNETVRIGLPGYLNDASKLLKRFGLGQKVDELVLAMNRAAESAIPLSKDLLAGAIQSMSVSDAKSILSGGDTSVTEFFSSKTREPMAAKFLPAVTQATEKVGAASLYNEVAGKAANFGVVNKDNANVQQYVTGKSLDGLYLMIGEEEKKLRQNPAAAGSALLSKVFGAVR